MSEIISKFQHMIKEIKHEEEKIKDKIESIWDRIRYTSLLSWFFTSILFLFLGKEGLAVISIIILLPIGIFGLMSFDESQIIEKSVEKKYNRENLVNNRNIFLQQNQVNLISYINNYYDKNMTDEIKSKIAELKLAFIDGRLNYSTTLLIELIEKIEINKVEVEKLKKYDKKHNINNTNEMEIGRNYSGLI